MLQAVYRYPAIRFDGTPESAFEVAKFADGVELTIRYESFPEKATSVTLRPTVDYVDWEEYSLVAGDVLVRRGAGQRITKLEGRYLENDSYTYVRIEELPDEGDE